MIEMLRSQWNESTTFPRLVELCAMLDGALQHQRPVVGPSQPPGSRCPKCGRIVKAEGSGPYRISVRAAILALGRFGIAPPELTKKLEKEWAQYRTQKRLDPDPSWKGHSIGKWEDDTLVVDTVGLNDKSWLPDGLPHTEMLHVIERYRRP